MFTVEFYQTENGYSELWDFLENLRIKSTRSKDARIQFNQISLYIELLQQKGTNLPDKITKYIEDNLWELRPGVNRILYFYHKENRFVLLHYFRKKTQKTPKREINKAKAEIIDYLKRNKEELR